MLIIKQLDTMYALYVVCTIMRFSDNVPTYPLSAVCCLTSNWYHINTGPFKCYVMRGWGSNFQKKAL